MCECTLRSHSHLCKPWIVPLTLKSAPWQWPEWVKTCWWCI